jgi:hypothetical protein
MNMRIVVAMPGVMSLHVAFALVDLCTVLDKRVRLDYHENQLPITNYQMASSK